MMVTRLKMRAMEQLERPEKPKRERCGRLLRELWFRTFRTVGMLCCGHYYWKRMLFIHSGNDGWTPHLSSSRLIDSVFEFVVCVVLSDSVTHHIHSRLTGERYSVDVLWIGFWWMKGIVTTVRRNEPQHILGTTAKWTELVQYDDYLIQNWFLFSAMLMLSSLGRIMFLRVAFQDLFLDFF